MPLTHSDIPPVPPITPAGFADPIWPRWLRLLRAKLAVALTNLRVTASNGFSGTVSRADASSADLELAVTASGMLKGVSGSLLTAIPGTDYTLPASYACVLDTTQQSAPAITRTKVTFDTLPYARNFTATLPGTAITCASPGLYNLQFSAQLINTSASLDDVVMWLSKNGVDVPNTNSLITIAGKHGSRDGTSILTVNFLVDLAAGDYIELYWATLLGTTSLSPYSTIYITAPLSPSVILTITQVFP